MNLFAPPPPADPGALPWREFIVAAHGIVQLLLFVYAAHRASILWRWWRARRRTPMHGIPPIMTHETDWPVVTVQLPVYNERHVVERLIEAAAALDYPAGRLEIQVLDDSTDDTRARAWAAAARHRARGVDVRHVRRRGRRGFKAGALAAGLRSARGELIAIFDADFVPPPDFLRRVVPAFSDPGVGMVQARWGHLNREASALTRAQAALLDAHFRVEQEARAAAGLFFNFNGSAGIWRRACIDDAGGWSHDTLTEDLDLSYRAQLRGWRFRFDGGVEAPAELPAEMEAFKGQQRRWVKGSIQTARKLLPRLLRARRPLPVRLEGAFYLTGHAVSALVLGDAILLAAGLLSPSRSGAALAGGPLAAGGPVTLALIPALAILAAGRRAAGGRGIRALADAAAALVLWIGLSLNNARAAWEGLGRRSGSWERTAKRGDGTGARRGGYAPARGGGGLAEAALALGFALVGAIAARDGRWWALPFLAALTAGFGAVAAGSLAGPRAYSRTILLERRPRRALRVSTMPRACRTRSSRSNPRWAVAMTTQS